LATNQHCVGENVQQYGFGRVASPHNIEEQAQHLVLLAQQLQDKRSSYDRYEEYYTNNSTQAFQAAIRIMLNLYCPLFSWNSNNVLVNNNGNNL